MELVALISDECTSPGDVTARLKNLFAGVLEKMLEAEMDEHLGEARGRSFCFLLFVIEAVIIYPVFSPS